MQSNQFRESSGFTNSFFEFDTKVDLPNPGVRLPQSPGELAMFLRVGDDASQDSLSYRNFFKETVNKLRDWASENGLNAEACDEFNRAYLGYRGDNISRNEASIHIYKEGIHELAGIVEHITGNKLSIDDCKNVVSNLLPGIAPDICHPGKYTNITNAYLELNSLLDQPLYWMNLRRKILEQFILSYLQPLPIKHDSMDIHYVNAVLNYYANMVGINEIRDENIANCNPQILAPLFRNLETGIPRLLSVASLINFASREEVFTNLSSRLEGSSSTTYSENMNRIMKALNKFGAEHPNCRVITGPGDIIRLYGELEDTVIVKWEISYAITLSILSRLMHSGRVKERYITYIFENDKVPVNLRGISYTTGDTANEERRVAPFIGIIKCLAYPYRESINKDYLAYLSDIERSHPGRCHFDRLAIAVGISRFLNSTEASYEQQKTKDELFSLIPEMLCATTGRCSADDLRGLIPHLSSIVLPELLEKIGDRLDLSRIKDSSSLNSFLSVLPQSVLPIIISKFQKDHLASLINSSGDVVRLVPFLPTEMLQTLLKEMGDRLVTKDYIPLYSLNVFLRVLPRAMLPVIIEKLRPNLRWLIRNSSDLYSVLCNVTEYHHLNNEDEEDFQVKQLIMCTLGGGDYDSTLSKVLGDCQKLIEIIRIFSTSEPSLRIKQRDLFGNIILSNEVKDRLVADKALLFKSGEDLFELIDMLPYLNNKHAFKRLLGDDFVEERMTIDLLASLVGFGPVNGKEFKKYKPYVEKFKRCIFEGDSRRAETYVILAHYLSEADKNTLFEKKLGHIIANLTSHYYLHVLLRLLPCDQRIDVIRRVPDTFIKQLPKQKANIIDAMGALPEADRLEFVERLLSQDLSQGVGLEMSRYQSLYHMLVLLPDNERKFALEYLNPIRYFDITDTTQMGNLFKKFLCKGVTRHGDYNKEASLAIDRALHEYLLERLLRDAPLQVLRRAYKHRYFINDGENVPGLNQIGLFSSKVESPSQVRLRKKIEHLGEKIEHLNCKRKFEQGASSNAEKRGSKKPRLGEKIKRKFEQEVSSNAEERDSKKPRRR